MKDYFQTTNSDFVSYLRVKKIPVVKTEKINFRQIAFFFNGSEEISLLWDMWQVNPNQEMIMIQNFVAEKDKVLSLIKMKMNDSDGGFYGSSRK